MLLPWSVSSPLRSVLGLGALFLLFALLYPQRVASHFCEPGGRPYEELLQVLEVSLPNSEFFMHEFFYG